MDLYGHLPAPKRPSASAEDNEGEQPPAKRSKAEEGEPGTAVSSDPQQESGSAKEQQQQQENNLSPPPTTSEQAPSQTVTTCAAMQRIAAHIGTKSKFPKACKLARQLLKSNAVTQETVDDFYKVLEQAMAPGEHVTDPALRGGYRELLMASAFCPFFSAKQRAQLEVWHIRAVVCNALFTDDSYEFSRAVKSVKDLVIGLDKTPPDAVDADKAVKEDYLDAIVQCVEVARSMYSHAWARTTIDILVKDAKDHLERFHTCGQRRLLDLWNDVKVASQKRRQAIQEPRGDKNSFEQMRSKWESATISIRSAVGSEGDHKSELKLG